MKKQTAVEKMAEWLNAEIGHYVPQDKLLYIQLIISNSKALEREQIVDAYDEGSESEYQYHISGGDRKKASTYYNETYGGE